MLASKMGLGPDAEHFHTQMKRVYQKWDPLQHVFAPQVHARKPRKVSRLTGAAPVPAEGTALQYLGTPVVPFFPFLGSGFPYIIYQQKKGTLIVIWLLGYQGIPLQPISTWMRWSDCMEGGVHFSKPWTSSWVAVKELELSYHNGYI